MEKINKIASFTVDHDLLVEKIENKLTIKFLIPVVTMVAVIALLVINIPAILEMVKFAITYYPV